MKNCFWDWLTFRKYSMENLTYLSKSGCLTKAPFGKNRVHRLRDLHEPTCFVRPCYLRLNRDAQGIMFHPSRQQLSFQRPKNKYMIFKSQKLALSEFIFCGHLVSRTISWTISKTILGQFHTQFCRQC